MVLKRLLVTTLGALGLGALAAGTASAQQIPAPDIFDDQVACSMNVPGAMATPMPTVVMDGMSTLNTLIGMGTLIIDTAGTGAGSYEELGYVIDPMVANCGGNSGLTGVGTPDSTPFTAATTGAAPTDVAEGYTDLLTKFVAVYGEPGDNDSTGAKGVLDAANTALAMGISRATPATGAELTALQQAVTRAEEAYNKAKATFDAANMGPINQAGAAEWMAKAAVTKSVVDYNAKVDAASGMDGMGGALGALNATAYVEAPAADGTAGASKWVPLGNNELFGGGSPVVTVDVGMGTGTVNLDQLIQYANGNLATPQVGMAGMAGMGTGDGSAGNEAAVASDTTASNFDAAGNLIIPMSVDSTNAAALVPTTSATNTVSDIRTLVDSSRIAAEELKKARDENVGLNQAIYDEAYRRAQAEADYYAARWAEVLADNTDQRTATQKLQFVDDDSSGANEPDETTPNSAYVKDPISIAARNADYTKKSNERVVAEADLRAKVAAREAATAAVRAAFTSPQGFYNQLVARRTALKAAADKVVADTTSPTAAQTKAAKDAADALMKAQEARDNLVGLFEDDNDPTVDLITELLMGDEDGDDGGALVEAISSNYDTANKAMTKADEVAEDVAGLIGDEGAVGQNKAAIEKNASDIEGLDGRVAMNEGEIWDEDGNSRIDANESRSMMNSTMIMTNTENIATNAANIMTNTMEIGYGEDGMSRIDHNEARSMQNATDVMTNAGHIMENRGMIESNTARVSSNADAIAANMNSIGQNASAIGDNRNMIGELSEDLDVVRAGVAASMALAGMPAINGRGISIGVGSFDGESAFAVGFQIQSDMASFKVGVTSASGATGASAGVGFQF